MADIDPGPAQWQETKERFLEGLSLVNMLPGATATQLGIFLGLFGLPVRI